jgi:hypothetical protein
MSHSLSELLLQYAQQFEDQHAPQNITIALREAAKELDRLKAGGCARNQGLTQYCAEAAEKDVEIARLKAEVERLRAALEEIASGKYSGIVLTSFPPQDPAVNRARAALTPSQEPRT